MKKNYVSGIHNVAYSMLIASTCIIGNANAQTSERYIRIDNDMLNEIVESGYLDWSHPVIFAVPAENAVMQNTLKSGKLKAYAGIEFSEDGSMLTCSDSESNSLSFTIEKLSGDNEFNIFSFNTFDPLGNISSTLYWDKANANEKFSIIFDDTDSHMLQLRSATKYSTTEYYSMVYDSPVSQGATGTFGLRVDDSKIFSLYCIDYYNMSLPDEDAVTDDAVNLTLTPHTAMKGYGIEIKYILNDGEHVSMSQLAQSTHGTAKIDWKGWDGGEINLTLPRYDEKATTLWILPTLDNTPFGLPYTCAYTKDDDDVSTGISDITTAAQGVAAEYYTISGSRVTSPVTPGIYIVRRDGKTSKIVIK